MRQIIALSISSLAVKANLIDFKSQKNTTGSRPSALRAAQSLTPQGANLETSSAMAPLSDYGCWCELGTHGNGKGQPQDEFDQFCKDLHKGYACIQMDHMTVGAGFCEPWSVDYVSAIADLNVDGAPGPLNLIIPVSINEIDEAMEVCENSNTDDCAVKACKVESYFYIRVFAASFEGVVPQMSLMEANFDDAVCITDSAGSPGGNRECCGSYPFRTPFRDGAGIECCNDVTRFNSNSKQCCGENVIDLNETC